MYQNNHHKEKTRKRKGCYLFAYLSKYAYTYFQILSSSPVEYCYMYTNIIIHVSLNKLSNLSTVSDDLLRNNSECKASNQFFLLF